MPKGIYAAASAMVVETRSLEVTARNLAHLQTPGYRQETALRSSFADELARQGHTGGVDHDGGTGVLPNRSYFCFTPGTLEPTGATYDVAISGNGFLRVRDNSGNLFLTRSGHFNTNAEGRLVTSEGWSVEGQGGPIVIPADARRVTIGEEGRITIETGEGANAAPQVLDQLRLVTVPEPGRMRAENGVYFDPGDQIQGDTTSATLRQGHLEKANIDPIQELAQMIALQRRYDAAQRALREQSNVGGGLSEMLRGS